MNNYAVMGGLEALHRILGDNPPSWRSTNYAQAMQILGNEQGTAAIREQLREEGIK
jgi:hypothetical protein